MEENKKRWIWRIVLMVVDLAIIGVLAYVRYPRVLEMNTPIPVIHTLSDAFFVIGFFNFGLGGLVKVSTTGFFDIFGYSAKAILNFFVPRSIFQDSGSYYEYKVKKAEKRKEIDLFNVMFWIGIGLMVIGCILLAILYI